MLVFKNGKGRFNNKTSYTDCFIEPILDGNGSRSDDGSFTSKSYKLLFDMDNVPVIPPQYIELQHENYGNLGLCYIQDIKYYNLTRSIEMSVEIRPHSISKIKTSIEFDDNGNPIPQQEIETESIACLYTKNSTAKEISIMDDGEAFVYSYEVALSRDCEEFKIGDIVVLKNHFGLIVAKKEVKGFTRQRFNSTLWM